MSDKPINPLVQQAIDQGFGPKITDEALLRKAARMFASVMPAADEKRSAA